MTCAARRTARKLHSALNRNDRKEDGSSVYVYHFEHKMLTLDAVEVRYCTHESISVVSSHDYMYILYVHGLPLSLSLSLFDTPLTV